MAVTMSGLPSTDVEPPDSVTHRFRVMASATHITAVGADLAALMACERRLRQLEARWSRFRADSDITRINQNTGRWVTVGADTVGLIDIMGHARAATGGRFDPTRLFALLDLGYTASIDDPQLRTLAVDAPSGASFEDVEIDHAGSAVRCPVGVSLDPGGIGKGYAADLIVTELVNGGAAGALACIGGDIALLGRPPHGADWIIDVDDPHEPARAITILGVSAGGVATSSTRSRRWTVAGREHHHLIDAITGDESPTDLASVTVVANAGWLAEAHATAALSSGTRAVIDYLVDRGLSGVAVDSNGAMISTPDLGNVQRNASRGPTDRAHEDAP